MDSCEHDELSQRVIGCAYVVSNTLGVGFLEKVHENALAHEFSLQRIRFAQQHPVAVRYNSFVVGEYVADFLVEGRLLLELKAVKEIEPIHEAQCLNYLRATGMELALLVNFGHYPMVEHERIANYRDYSAS